MGSNGAAFGKATSSKNAAGSSKELFQAACPAKGMMIVTQKSRKSNASKQWKMHNQPVEDAQLKSNHTINEDAQLKSNHTEELGHERRGLRGEITLAL